MNPLIWALNAILCLKYGRQRLNQACFAFEQALALGLKDALLLEELGDMLEAQSMHDEAVRVYSLVSRSLQQDIEAQSGSGVEEVRDEDEAQVVDMKRARGLILQKLGKIQSSETYKGYDIEEAINTFKTAIKMVHGVNNKQNIALMLQGLLTQVNREHELA